MERLTTMCDGRPALAQGYAEGFTESSLFYMLLNRLAAYEDTITLERARELAQAEKDGRLVVLPCKVGDTVYIIRDKKIFIAKVETLHQWVGGVWNLNAYTDKRYSQWIGYEVFFNDFGKTVFLTREEAEAALKKREEADNEAD